MRYDDLDIPKLEYHILKSGTTLYHATSAKFNERNESLNSPVWFSNNPETTVFFSDWAGELGGRKRIIAYKLIEDTRLLLIQDKNTISELEEYHGIDIYDPISMAEGVCLLGCDGWFIPNNYKTGHDIMLCNSDIVIYKSTKIIKD